MTTARAMPIHRSWPAAGLLLASALVVWTVAACASPASAGGGGSGGGGSVDPTGVVSSGPMPPPNASSGSGTPNLASPESAVNLRKVRWTQAEPLSGTPAVLINATLTGAPPCSVLGRVDVAESASQVTITLWVGQRAGAECDGAQAELGYPIATRVALKTPVGDRDVRDGAA